MHRNMRNIIRDLKAKYSSAIQKDCRRRQRLAIINVSPTLRDIRVSVDMACRMHGISEELLQTYIDKGYVLADENGLSLYDMITLNIVNINIDLAEKEVE